MRFCRCLSRSTIIEIDLNGEKLLFSRNISKQNHLVWILLYMPNKNCLNFKSINPLEVRTSKRVDSICYN